MPRRPRLAAAARRLAATGGGIVVALGVLGLGGIGPLAWLAGNGSSTPARPYEVIENLDDFFDPRVIRVEVGTVVEWENAGRNPHTVTADDGSVDSGILEHGDEFDLTFETPGVFAFNCRLHGAAGGIGMAGIVVVGDVPLPSSGAAAGVGPGREPVPDGPGRTIRVPAEQPTIQAGVDAAAPGDLVLVARGVYAEGVLVRTPYLTIRGEDRAGVVLDGEFRRANGIHVVEADGVAIENMTARHYAVNGFYWVGVHGYRGSYLTAYANGDYGLYAFDSVWGRFERSYASGHPDSGFYIGQCRPCHAVIDDVVAVRNALGYSGTNAGGDLAIVNSEWAWGLSGIVPNTLDSERLAPQSGVLITGNWIHDNSATDVPTKRLQWPTYGVGVLVGGGRANVVEGNLVEDHATFGIGIMPNLDDNFWASRDNVVRGNVVRRSGRADLALGAPSVRGDCFAANDHATSLPPAIEVFAGCDGRIGGGGELGATFGILGRFAQALGGNYPSGDWQSEPEPAAQPSMPDALTAAPVLAIPEVAVPGAYAVRSLGELETLASAVQDPHTVSQEVTVLGIGSSSILTFVLGLYGYVLPLALYAAWVSISMWDLVRREELSGGRRVLWMAAILVLPVVGPAGYLLAGGSAIQRSARLFLVFGGIAIYLAVAAAAFLVEAL